jgi:hypothetical protein
MRGQKGGSFTKNGVTYSAEYILDKFTKTYLHKDKFYLEPSIVKTLQSYIENAKNKDYYKWFDATKNLILEDSELTQEGIDKRIYHGIVETGKKKGISTFQFPITPYEFTYTVNGTTNHTLAYQPSIKQIQDGAWQIFVKDPKTKKDIATEIVLPGNTVEEALEKIVFNGYINIIQSEYAEYVSGFNTLNATLTLDETSLCIFNDMKKSNKILFLKKENKPGNIRPIYCEQKPSDPRTFLFHPHNLLNFLPQSKKENDLRLLFEEITSQLNASIINTNTNYIYSLDPDKFYHIHVTYVPNEENIILTIHAAFEDLRTEAGKEKLKKYIYINQKGTRKVLGRFGAIESFINTIPNNTKSQQSTEMKQKVKEMRYLHNAIILLKPNKQIHSIYRLSKNNLVGNPFLTDKGKFLMQFVSPFSNFAFFQSNLGNPVMDLMHISGKGVMISNYNEECQYFCDIAQNNIVKKMVQDLVINPGYSNPIEPDQLFDYLVQIPGYLDTINQRTNPNLYDSAQAVGATNQSSANWDKIYSLLFGGRRNSMTRNLKRMKRTRKSNNKNRK